ncbi:hypothetical protein NKDENANG_01469 [Candidatus Entotheonellaceae bacterium PAL068K]
MPPINQHLPPEPAPSAVDTEPTEAPAPSLDWMQACRQWGTRAPLGPHGLTMRAINIGIYGDIPDTWDEMTRMPRGASPVEGVPRIEIYSLTNKAELWAENVPELYEEAIQRRWNAQIDIVWETIPPLPQDVELAMCQLCTELSQQAAIDAEVVGHWIYRMCYGYHEVKSFLATQAFDAARHFEAFRQRAVAHGRALGMESPGLINRRILEVRGGWTETALVLYIVRGTLTLWLYRYGEAQAHNAAEKRLFRRSLQDKARHLAYGLAHLKYAIEQKGTGYALGLKRLLIGVERDLAKEMQDPVLWEALAILCAGGLRHIEAGMAVVRRLQHQYIDDYLRRLQWVGIAKAPEELTSELQAYLHAET